MDNRTMPVPGPTDDSEWRREIDRGLDPRVQLQPPATDTLLQPALDAGTLLDESEILLSHRKKIRDLEVRLRRSGVEVKRQKRKIADSEKKRKAVARKIGKKLGESEREKRLLTSRVEALEKEKRAREQKVDQAHKGEKLSERMVDALQIEKRSPGQKPEQDQKGKELCEQLVDALQIEKRSPGQKPEQCQKGKELCEQQVDALPKENRSPEQKPDQVRQKALHGRDCRDSGQANPVASKQKVSLECKIGVSQEDLELRQMTTIFNQIGPGMNISRLIMDKVRADPLSRSVFKDLVSKNKSFSATVMHLSNVKKSLEKEMNHPNVSSDRRSKIPKEIESANEKLSLLLRAAKSITCSYLKWTEVDSEGYFHLCSYVAQVHEACHPPMTSTLLNSLKNRAFRGDYDCVSKTVGHAIEAATRLVSIELDRDKRELDMHKFH